MKLTTELESHSSSVWTPRVPGAHSEVLLYTTQVTYIAKLLLENLVRWLCG